MSNTAGKPVEVSEEQVNEQQSSSVNKEAADETQLATTPQSPFQQERCKILEVSQIPAMFKNIDLHNIFRPYQTSLGGYRIFWIDDDQALIDFYDWAMAKRAFLENVDHAVVKVRPYSGPLPEKYLERKDDTATKDPLRPKTNTTIARRIVHHALGVGKQPVTGRALEELQKLERARAEKLPTHNGNTSALGDGTEYSTKS
ncbi:hypothetical protein BDF19DRAFT_461413 [Syncephalis fuscata]|nr:hypothetical protein BDF19DRAFT_461413 [Syncephalis fuscata]